MTYIKRLMPVVVNVGALTYCYLLLPGLENRETVTQSNLKIQWQITKYSGKDYVIFRTRTLLGLKFAYAILCFPLYLAVPRALQITVL